MSSEVDIWATPHEGPDVAHSATKDLHRDALRDTIQAATHLADMETIALMLFGGREMVGSPGREVGIPLDELRTKQIVAAAKIKALLLGKVLPEIRAVELTEMADPTNRTLATLDLRNRLRVFLEAEVVPTRDFVPDDAACLN